MQMIKQAVCKTVAFGRCRFKSCSADYMPQSLNWWRSCLEDSRPVIPACRFESCLRRCHIWRRVLTGRQPVPNTGDPKGFGGSKSPLRSGRRRADVHPDVVRPPSSLISRFGRIGKCTCPLSRGRLIRHPGSGPGSGAHPGSNWFSWFFLKTCNKALKLYYEYNDKAFKRCYSGCQKK